MQKINYHKRENYEKQYLQLCKETNTKPILLHSLDSYGLLLCINTLLVKLDCIPFDRFELNMQLV